MRGLQGSTERSQELNEAYAMLTEMSPAELTSYERELRLRGPAGPTLKCAALQMATETEHGRIGHVPNSVHGSASMPNIAP